MKVYLLQSYKILDDWEPRGGAVETVLRVYLNMALLFFLGEKSMAIT